MTMRVTMTTPRRSEDGLSVLLNGSTYTVGDNFGKQLVQMGAAVDTDGAIASEVAEMRDHLLASEARTTRSLVSGAWNCDVSGVGGAAANTAGIQGQLTACAAAGGGIVQLLGRGVAHINATLSIPSNTEVQIASGLTIRAAPTMGKVMMVNASYSATPTTLGAGELTFSGLTATLARTGIGALYPVGSYISILGATQEAYSGVWRVTVSSANSISWTLSNTPAATPATGTITHRTADVNVAIIGGGVIDYDQATNSSASTLYDASAVIFFNCHTPRFDGPRVRNAKKYGVWFTNTSDSIGRRVHFSTASDGMHLCGPQRGVAVFEDLSGYCGDDILGLSNGDNPTGELSRGESDHVRIRCINGENSAIALVSIVGGGASTIRWHDIDIDGVYGSCLQTPLIVYEYVTGGATLHTTYIEKLSLRNINCTAWANGPMVSIGGSTNGATVENLTIDNIKPVTAMTGAQSELTILQKATVKRGVISNIAGTYVAAATTGHFVWVLDTATVTSLEIIEFDTVPVTNAKNALISTGASTVVGRIKISNGQHVANTQGYLTLLGSACDLYLTNVYSSSANSTMVVSSSGITVNLYTSNWRHAGNFPTLGVAGSTINWEGDISTSAAACATSGSWGYINGPTIKIDANTAAPTAPRAGDQFWNTNAAWAGSASVGLKGRTNAGAWAAIF